MIAYGNYHDRPQVIRSTKDGLLYVNYGEMEPELLEAINELHNKISSLEDELDKEKSKANFISKDIIFHK